MQHPFPLDEFLKRYGTEEKCVKALYRWRWRSGFKCPRCGNRESQSLAYRNFEQCKRCRRQTSPTAGTVLHATRLPLTAWFLGAYIMNLYRNKKACSAVFLSRFLGISYNAAWRMRRKLLLLVTDKERPLRL